MKYLVYLYRYVRFHITVRLNGDHVFKSTPFIAPLEFYKNLALEKEFISVARNRRLKDRQTFEASDTYRKIHEFDDSPPRIEYIINLPKIGISLKKITKGIK